MNKKINRFSRTAIAIVLCLSMTAAYAAAEDKTEKSGTATTKAATTSTDEDTLKDLQKKYDKLEEKINQNEKKLNQIESSKSQEEAKYKKLNSEVSDLDSQISVLNEKVEVLDSSISRINGEIDQLDSEIEGLNKQISQINGEIADTETSISDRYEKLRSRLIESYVTGTVSDLQILLSSTDFATFLNNMEMLEIAAEYDKEMIDGLETDLAELNELNTRHSNSKKELDGKVSELSSKKNSLSASQADAKSNYELLESKQATASAKRAESYKLLGEMDKNSKEYKKAIAEYEAEKKRVEAEIDRITLERGSTTNDKVVESADGDVRTTGKYVSSPLKNMKWPVPYNNCYISSGYGWRDLNNDGVKEFHNGIDICVRGGSEGKDIVAAQNGKVIKTGYGDSSRGNYILIDHGSGVTTAYYHCKKLFVKEGQFVNKGERIALIGSTGFVTGPHLHFGVHISNGKSVDKVNPSKYVSMP